MRKEERKNMTREQIEKAIDARLDEPENHWDGIFNSGYSRGFTEGAEWRINTVWHDASEEPERNGDPMLVEFQDFGMDENDYDVVEDLQGYRTGIYVEFKRWAYVSELLPKRKKD